MSLTVQLEFSGGAELLFDRVKYHKVQLPQKPVPWTLRHLIAWIAGNLVKERTELFTLEETVRPGILVLVNNIDWELLGHLDYELQNDDTIVFISTLHGG